MNSDLFFDNKKYISVKDASSLTSYSKDYIGQLCRQNKIKSKRIGKGWYVEEDSILNYRNFSPDLSSMLNSVGEEKYGLKLEKSEQKILSRISEIISPLYSKLISDRRYKLFIHELLFSYDFSLIKKLLPLALGLTLAVGSVSLWHKLLSLETTTIEMMATFRNIQNEMVKKRVTLSNISNKIDVAPSEAYKAVDEISDFYSTELALLYLKTGESVLSLENKTLAEGKLFFQNPAKYIVQGVEEISVAEKDFVDFTLLRASDLISNVHIKTFTFVSKLFDNILYSLSDTQIYVGATLLSFRETTNPVDNLGMFVYNKINSLVEFSIYSPLAQFFNTTSEIVNTVFVEKNIPLVKNPLIISNNKTTSPTPNVIQKIIERIIEKPVAGVLTRAVLDEQLQILSNKLISQMSVQFSGLSTGSGGSITNVYQQIASSQKIDN